MSRVVWGAEAQLRAIDLLRRVVIDHPGLPLIRWTVTDYAIIGEPDDALLTEDEQRDAWQAWVSALGLPQPTGERLFTVVGRYGGSGFNVVLQSDVAAARRTEGGAQ